MYIVIRKASFSEDEYSVMAFSYKKEDAEKSLDRLSKGSEYVFQIMEEEDEDED